MSAPRINYPTKCTFGNICFNKKLLVLIKESSDLLGNYFTYITTNPNKTVLYTGMFNRLEQRIVEHFLARGNNKSFAGKYYCYFLLYFERFQTPIEAIEREKEIKAMSRKEKEALISNQNPRWNFLNATIMDWPPHPDRTSR